ncbi:MAG: decaprenyl-phosphate phosphoribosyltransferase [Gemmatimonadota bacterium]|nr:MAG: decaprenyl-phosphate phosphoribosyltransferase [Gemmatimonadota bacterium]
MTALLSLMRPKQWIKNVVVFAGIVFAGRLSDPQFLQAALLAFAVFCLASSGIYVFNDLLDVDKDRLHPDKRTRPIASGQVKKRTALVVALVLWVAAALAAFQLGPRFGGTILAFLALNILYSAWLKRGVIIDVMSISVSFMLRATGGVEVLRDLDASVELSQWLLLCTFFLALVMGFGKRRSELVLLDDSASSHRAALGQYSVALLDVIIPMVSACAILAYSIYTIWPDTVSRLGTDKLVYTVPLVVYGFFRYLFLVRERELGGNPSEILFRDRALLTSVAAWAAAIVGLLYFG